MNLLYILRLYVAKIKMVKGKLLESGKSTKIFEGFPYNLYDILPPELDAEEMRKATLLIKIILRSASLNSLSSELGADNASIVAQFRNGVVQFIDLNTLIHILPTAKQTEILKLNLLPVTSKLGINHKVAFIDYVLNSAVGYRSEEHTSELQSH